MKRLPEKPQRGMALVAVLWMVAALSIIVSGMVQTARNEVRMSASSKQMVIANAWGDAAIHLALQELSVAPQKPSRLTYINTTYHNLPIRVQVMPLNGLIDINRAPLELLSGLLTLAGKVDAATAARLAQAIVEGRTQPGGGANNRAYEAIEDLLNVPGMTYPVYANIAALITADARGSGRVNPLAAPSGVLAVLADGNLERATKVAADRDAGLEGIDTTTTLNGAFIENNAGARRFRLQARVPLPDGRWLLSSRSVDFAATARDGLPWLSFHTESRLEPALSKSN